MPFCCCCTFLFSFFLLLSGNMPACTPCDARLTAGGLGYFILSGVQSSKQRSTYVRLPLIFSRLLCTVACITGTPLFSVLTFCPSNDTDMQLMICHVFAAMVKSAVILGKRWSTGFKIRVLFAAPHIVRVSTNVSSLKENNNKNTTNSS